MKIQINSDGHNLRIVLPTRLVFSRVTARIAGAVGSKYASDALEGIPPEAMDVLFAELRRIKKQYGTWELVNIDSADGDKVTIIL